MLKFIVLSDTHIVRDGQTNYGIDTYARLMAAVDFINTRHADADFVICAGDLTDLGEAEAYDRVLSALSLLRPKTYITLGNHDDAYVYQTCTHGKDDNLSKLDHVIDAHGYRVIVLNSAEAEAGHAGRINTEQLNWLSTQLTQAMGKPVVIVMHHNIAALDIQTDSIMLQSSGDFLRVLAQHPDIRQVICGHVHMTTSGMVNGIPFCTLAGAHYSIEPILYSVSGDDFTKVPRREGPGQIAIVLGDEDRLVVHFENFFDTHRILTLEEMGWQE